MAAMTPGGPGPRIAAQNDLYTVLLIAASAILLFGIIFIAVRSTQFFGSLFPQTAG